MFFHKFYFEFNCQNIKKVNLKKQKVKRMKESDQIMHHSLHKQQWTKNKSEELSIYPFNIIFFYFNILFVIRKRFKYNYLEILSVIFIIYKAKI